MIFFYITHLQPAEWVPKTLRVSQIYLWFRKSFHCDLHIASSVDLVVKATFTCLYTALWEILSGLIPWEIRLESTAWLEQWHCHMLPLCDTCTNTWNVKCSQLWASFMSSVPPLKCRENLSVAHLLPICRFCFGFAVLPAASVFIYKLQMFKGV